MALSSNHLAYIVQNNDIKASTSIINRNVDIKINAVSELAFVSRCNLQIPYCWMMQRLRGP